MAYDSQNAVARQILGHLDLSTQTVKQHKQSVVRFAEQLSRSLRTVGGGYVNGSHIRHAGSAYEHLEVHGDADFDLVLELGEPFVSRNFMVYQDRTSGFIHYLLKCKHYHAFDGAGRRFIDSNGVLKSEELRNDAFDRLHEILTRMNLPNLSVHQHFRKLSAMQVNLKVGGTILELDITPQIAAHSWSECPGLVPLGTLPPCLRQYISENERNGSPIMYFTPAVPQKERTSKNVYHCMLGFSMLEKHFLQKEVNIHDMVRLAKLVKDRLDWSKKYDFKSFHLKRLAIKGADTLRPLTIWDGFKTLIKQLSIELGSRNGIIDCFVQQQVIYTTDRAKMMSFQQELQVVSSWSAERIKNLALTK